MTEKKGVELKKAIFGNQLQKYQRYSENDAFHHFLKDPDKWLLPKV